MNHNIIYLVIAWSLLASVGYNVLSVEADEKEDMAEDIRKMKFVNDDLDDYGLKEIAIEQECKDNGGQWKDDNWCKFDKIGGNDEVEFEHQLEDRGLSYYYADKEYLGDEWSKYQNEKYEKEQENEKASQKLLAEEPTKIDGLFEDELEREDVDKYCDASEDYKKHPKQCDRYYKVVEKREEDNRQYNQELQKICKDVGSEWKDGVCDAKGDDEKANQFHEKSLLINTQEQSQMEDEQQRQEDERQMYKDSCEGESSDEKGCDYTKSDDEPVI